MSEALIFAELPAQQQFDDGLFPCVLINPGLEDLAEVLAWLGDHRLAVQQALARSGTVLFRGFPVTSAQAFDDFSAAFGYRDFTYQESLSNAVRLNHTHRVFTANEAPPAIEIFLHHEMAQTPVSPAALFFYCHQAAAEGGATSLCRSDKLYEQLLAARPAFAHQLESQGLQYTTVMPRESDPLSGQGRSWASTLSVDNQADAEARLAALGYTWRWFDDGSLQAVTPVLPGVLLLEDGTRVLYNQLIAAYRGWARAGNGRQSPVTFGDGATIAPADLEQLSDMADQLTFNLTWQDQDIALVDNRRVMHGRRPFSGERRRQVLVALAADQLALH